MFSEQSLLKQVNKKSPISATNRPIIHFHMSCIIASNNFCRTVIFFYILLIVLGFDTLFNVQFQFEFILF